VLGESYRPMPDINESCKKNYCSIYMEYNLLLYDRFHHIREDVSAYKEGFLEITAEVVRLHNNCVTNLPIVPVFFFENLLDELFHLFAAELEDDNMQELLREKSGFNFLKKTGDRICFPCFDEYYLRDQLISMSKTFVKCFVKKFSEKTLRQFLRVMSAYSMPEAEIIIDKAKVFVLKSNNNLGYLLLNQFTKLRYSTLYIGKKVDELPLNYQSGIIIVKTSLLDEMNYENQISFNNLNGLLRTTKRFIKENKNAVIMVNGLDDMLFINSFDKVIEFMQNMQDIIRKSDVRFILLGNLLTLNEDEEQYIESEFDLLNKINFFYSNK